MFGHSESHLQFSGSGRFSALYYIICSESPWWLVRLGKIEEAVKAVKRLSSKRLEPNARQVVAMMVHTDKLERDLKLPWHLLGLLPTEKYQTDGDCLHGLFCLPIFYICVE